MLFPGFIDYPEDDQSLVNISMTSSCDDHYQTLLKKQSSKQQISQNYRGDFHNIFQIENGEIRLTEDEQQIRGILGLNKNQSKISSKSTHQFEKINSIKYNVTEQNLNKIKQSPKPTINQVNTQTINNNKTSTLNPSQINFPNTLRGSNQIRDSVFTLRGSYSTKDLQKNNNKLRTEPTLTNLQIPQQSFYINIIQPQQSERRELELTKSIMFQQQKPQNIQSLKNSNRSQKLAFSHNVQKTNNAIDSTRRLIKTYTCNELPQSSTMKKLKLRDYIELDKLNGKRKKQKIIEESNISTMFSTRRNSSGSDAIGSKLKAELKNNIRNLQQCLRKTLERVDCVNNQGQNKQEQMMVIFTLGKIIKENMMKGGSELEKYLSQTDN